jgi:hypothetical protein
MGNLPTGRGSLVADGSASATPLSKATRQSAGKGYGFKKLAASVSNAVYDVIKRAKLRPVYKENLRELGELKASRAIL